MVDIPSNLFIGIVLLIVLFGIITGLFIGGIVVDYYSGAEQMGNAICSEKYNSDFIKYSDDMVYCKPKLIGQKYDGIRIILRDDNNEKKEN